MFSAKHPPTLAENERFEGLAGGHIEHVAAPPFDTIVEVTAQVPRATYATAAVSVEHER